MLNIKCRSYFHYVFIHYVKTWKIVSLIIILFKRLKMQPLFCLSSFKVKFVSLLYCMQIVTAYVGYGVCKLKLYIYLWCKD